MTYLVLLIGIFALLRLLARWRPPATQAIAQAEDIPPVETRAEEDFEPAAYREPDLETWGEPALAAPHPGDLAHQPLSAATLAPNASDDWIARFHRTLHGPGLCSPRESVF